MKEPDCGHRRPPRARRPGSPVHLVRPGRHRGATGSARRTPLVSCRYSPQRTHQAGSIPEASQKARYSPSRRSGTEINEAHAALHEPRRHRQRHTHAVDQAAHRARRRPVVVDDDQGPLQSGHTGSPSSTTSRTVDGVCELEVLCQCHGFRLPR